MKFRILSHAGLEVTSGASRIVCDPWLVGSTYWRSWWNYPPPDPELLATLEPTHAIFLTHVHWDHFQGPSLRKFPRDTPIVVPKGHYSRMRDDLRKMGFPNVIELPHGETFRIGQGLRVTSYAFNPFLDSALVIEADGVTLLNANDAKIMGRPLDHMLGRHPKIDFVFRSHSSANSRLCFEVVDAPSVPVDDLDRYLEQFAAFAARVSPRYAVPFASNHCFLHKDTFSFNATVQTPLMVERFFAERNISSPELKVMLPGDSWSSDSGFDTSVEKRQFFTDRDARLAQYQASMSSTLEAFYAREGRAKITLEEVQKYFSRFSKALPWALRQYFRGHTVHYVAHAGDARVVFAVDLTDGSVRLVDGPAPGVDGPLEIHTSAYVLRQCMALDLFSHLPISKRVRYRVSRRTKRRMTLLNLLFNAYEYDFVPLANNMSGRSLDNWMRRWREVALYASFVGDVVLRGGVDPNRYLAS
jgi:UDP-MurNAc hydroxylase